MKHKARCVTIVGCALLFSVAVVRGRSGQTQTSQPTAQARTETTPAGAPTALERKKARILDAYGKVPLSFEPNRGQTDPRVKFLSRGSGYTVFLTSNEAVLTFQQPSGVPDASLDGALAPRAPHAKRRDAAALRMRLVGGNAAPAVAGLDALPSRSHYFIGKDAASWHTNVPTYGKVRYQEAYPGIDLAYYGHRRQLEYDFVVAPGADPSVITLAFDGAARMRIDSGGDLVLQSGAGEARFHKPVVYQTHDGGRTYVDGRYERKARNQVRFEIAEYDHTTPLVIDPTLSYSTYLGGAGYTTGTGIGVDDAGNFYVVGSTASRDFPTVNAVQPTTTFSYDAFVAAFDPTGSTLLYSTYFGGRGDDFGTAMAVDGAGRVYLTGWTYSADFPTVNPFQATNNSGDSAFVAAFESGGASLIYSTYLGSTGTTRGTGIAVDHDGNAYVTGIAVSNFLTVNPAQAVYGGGEIDGFVASFDPTGSWLRFATYLGGSGRDNATAIAVDGAGRAFVTGYTVSSDFPTVNALQPAYRGEHDAFVTAYDATGCALLYSTYLGGSGDDFGRGIAVDSAGRAFVTGDTRLSDDFPLVNPLQPARSGARDAFVAAFNPDGATLLYATYLGGSSDENGYGIAVDSSGNAYVTGYTPSHDFPTVDPVQAAIGDNPTFGGRGDVFIAEVDSSGAWLRFSTYLGGGFDDYGYGIAVDRDGNNIYVTGDAVSKDFPTVNPIQATNTSGNNSWPNAFAAIVSLSAVSPPPPADAPAITPPGGTFDQPLSAALTTTTSGATIHYTTDGSTPTPSSYAYTGPIAITQTTTIQAIARASGMLDSTVSSATFTLQAATPTFDPPGRSYLLPQRVSISDASPGTTIYYTINGSTPTSSSPKYTGPILVLRTTTIKAMAVAPGWSQSPVANATYQTPLPSGLPLPGSNVGIR
jgi:hypothetical protein